MRTAIYPGTFDPITLGHIDVIKKSLKIVDRIIVATTDNINKNYYFDINERLEIIKKYNASIIIRGLRAVSDFEYEFQLAGMNKKLNNNIETIFLMSDLENQIISSKFVKEIAKLDGDIKKFLTKSATKALKDKFWNEKIIFIFDIFFVFYFKFIC